MARQYLERLGKTGVTYFGEKTPEHSGHLPSIRKLFPEAKILVLYRDGRDVGLKPASDALDEFGCVREFHGLALFCTILRKQTARPSPNVYCTATRTS